MEAPSNTDVNKVKRQMGIVYKIWTDTHKALCEATSQAYTVSSETTTLKAVISFILMKKFFLEVGKKLPPMAIMDNWKVNDIVTFVRRANNYGRFLDKLDFDENEQIGLILVSLRYSTEPYILAGAAWILANKDIELAVRLLCPTLYSMKNRDYDFLGQEVANLRIYWQGGASVDDSDDVKIAKLFDVGAKCDEECMKLWDILYNRVENSLNPCGVPQFVNLLGGYSLNGTWEYSELATFINEKVTLEWMDNRYGDAGKIISLLWNRIYNLIVDEEDKTEEKMEEKLDNMREFLDMITQSVDDYRANEIFLHMKLPELISIDVTANMIDEDPICNQFFKYTSSLREYPLFFTRRAFELTNHHITKTLDIMAWWKEFHNAYDISANQIWDCIFNDKETDEGSLESGYGNIDDFNKLAKELIDNNNFRKGVDMDKTEEEFFKVFSDLASGIVLPSNNQISSRYSNLPSHSERMAHYSTPPSTPLSSHSRKQGSRYHQQQQQPEASVYERSISSDSTQDMIIRKSKSPAELKKSQKKHKATRRSSKMEKKTSKDNLRKQGRTSSLHSYGKTSSISSSESKLESISSQGEEDLEKKAADMTVPAAATKEIDDKILDSIEDLNISEKEGATCAADVLN